MELKEVLSISGKPGLYRMVAKTRGGLLVESLLDAKRLVVPMTSKVSALSDIAIFTTDGEAPLHTVFTAIKPFQKEAESLDIKRDEEGVKALFAKVLPNYAEHRVYPEVMRKVFKWFLLLTQQGMDEFTPPADESASASGANGQSAEPAVDKTGAKSPADADRER